MELRHLRYFIRAAELLHFTRAAQSLYISQPTLSSHIYQLEEEVGSLLFDRVGRSVRLTEAGNIFLNHALRAIEQLDTAARKISAMKSLAGGTLRIASLQVFGHRLLPSWIADFNAKHPQVLIIVKTGATNYVEEELQSGRVDLGLAVVPVTASDLSHQRLFTEDIVMVVGKSHPFAIKRQIRFEELCNTPLALMGRDTGVRRLFDSILAVRKLTPNITIEIDDLQALVKIAASGNAATLLSRWAIANHPDLHLIPIIEPTMSLDFGVLWHKQVELCPAAQAFLQHIMESQ